MTTLTMEMILDKTKVDNADSVRHLNLWGEQLADVSVVKQLKNIEVLALASNMVSSLKPFAACEGLQELYLRKNSVSNLREVTNLTGLKKLFTLWLMDNPCAKHPFYRDFVLHCCPYLKQLDNTAVTREERVEAAKRLSPKVLDEILGRSASAAPSLRDKDAPPALAASPKKPFSPAPSQPRLSGGTPASAPSHPRPSSGTPPPPTHSSPPPSAAASRPRKSTSAQPSIPPRSTASPSTGGTPVNNDTPMGESSTAVLFTTVQAQRAMLLSIVSLLPELTVDSLEMLRKEVQERLEKQREKTEKLGSNSRSN